MLWSAYGDALGFISELVDTKRLMHRTGGAALNRLMEWEHRVGGRWGVNVTLPTGCWSDDTQLRMAVSRSIGPDGFDVEAFARVELPVWPSYALGGGRASKAAAKNLAKPTTPWYANTFPRWADAGGNGTAMRTQPHVWASPLCPTGGAATLAVPLDDDVVLDVIADSVCTHGHPRALVGACFHAAALAHCLAAGSVPDADDCMGIADGIRGTAGLIENHQHLGAIWMGLWEQETGEQFHDQWLATVDELRFAIDEAMGEAAVEHHYEAGEANQAASTDRSVAALNTPAVSDLDTAYTGMINRLGLRARHQRGSAILTTVAAAALAAASRDAYRGVVAAANAVGTDTDTIATMAGALLGACDAAGDPPEDPLDRDCLLREADRLSAISQGKQTKVHTYPDLLTWVPPKSQADALVSHNGGLVAEGLGPVTALDADAVHTPNGDFAWQWVKTRSGQTLLIKRRPEVKPLHPRNDPAPPAAPRNAPHARRAATPRPRGRTSRNRSTSRPTPRNSSWRTPKAISYAKRQTSDDKQMGSLIRRVAQEGTRGDFLTVMKEIYDELQH